MIPLFMQTATPSPSSSARLTEVEAGLEALKVFRDFTLPMAILVVIFSVIIVVGMWIFFNRNKGKEYYQPMTTLSTLIAELQAEKIDIREDANEKENRFIDGLIPIGDAMNRLADISKQHADNEARLIASEATQTNLLTEVKTKLEQISEQGSEPLRQFIGELKKVFDNIESINAAMQTVPQMQNSINEINERLDTVVSRAKEEKKRASQPLPTVEVIVGEAQTVESE